MEKKDLQFHQSEDVFSILKLMRGSRLWPGICKAGMGRFPFEEDMFRSVREGNPLPQKYYYLEQGERFAFFSSYENRMDLLTFGRAQWFMKLRSIAFPCSLSSGGYLTNDTEWMLEKICALPGCSLVLNLPKAYRIRGMACGETLPTCILTLRPEHRDLGGYLASLRSPYRRRIALALRHCEGVDVQDCKDNSIDVYPLYRQTFERSEYKLECLERSFFESVEGERLVFLREGRAVGFVLLRRNGEELVFLLCGMDYAEEERGCKTADLYYFMLLKIVEYAITHQLKRIDLGQTSEQTKLKFGAVLEKRYFCAHHANPLLNLVAVLGKSILEYRYSFPEYRVFK
ncbi:MAG: hypothetical protein IK115_08565 [Lachnospiraceae bacterium]|nr:hypothetical protein [Lachnospiraceae bacterium]